MLCTEQYTFMQSNIPKEHIYKTDDYLVLMSSSVKVSPGNVLS